MFFGKEQHLDHSSNSASNRYKLYCVKDLPENVQNYKSKYTQKNIKCKNTCAECSLPKKAAVSTNPDKKVKENINSRIVKKLKSENYSTHLRSRNNMSGNYSLSKNRNIKTRRKEDNEPVLYKYSHHIDNEENSFTPIYHKNRKGMKKGDICRCDEINVLQDSQVKKKQRKEMNVAEETFNNADPIHNSHNKDIKTQLWDGEKNILETKTPKPKNRITCLCHSSRKRIDEIEHVYAEGPIRAQENGKGIGKYQKNDCYDCLSLPVDTRPCLKCTNRSTTHNTAVKITNKIACLCSKYSHKKLNRTQRRSTLPKCKEISQIHKFNKQNTSYEEKLEQTGDPFIEIKLDAVDKCVLNSNEVKNNLLFSKQVQNRKATCICRSHKKQLHTFYKSTCPKGICGKTFKNKNTNFTCKCSKIRECTDTTCDVDSNIKKNTPYLKETSLPKKYNNAMFDVKLDINSMCVLNSGEVEKNIHDEELKAKKLAADVCHTGLCTKTDKRGIFTCKCVEKKRRPEEIIVTECSDKTCNAEDKSTKAANIKTNILGELFKNMYICKGINDDDKQKGIQKDRTKSKTRKVRKSIDTKEIQNIKSIVTCFCSQILNSSINHINKKGEHNAKINGEKLSNIENKVFRKDKTKPETRRVRKSIDTKDIQNIKSILKCFCSQMLNKSDHPNSHYYKNGELNAKPKENIHGNKKGASRIVGRKDSLKLKTISKQAQTNSNNKKRPQLLKLYEKNKQVEDFETQRKTEAAVTSVKYKSQNKDKAQLPLKMNAQEIGKDIIQAKMIPTITKKKGKVQQSIEGTPNNPLFEIKLDSRSMCVLNAKEVEENIKDDNLIKLREITESSKGSKRRRKKMVRGTLDTKYFSQIRSKSENIPKMQSLCRGKTCTPRIREDLVKPNRKCRSFLCSSLCALISRCKKKEEQNSLMPTSMTMNNKVKLTQPHGDQMVLADGKSCICCICGNDQSQCKCKVKTEISLRQCVGDSFSCLLKILGISDLLHSGKGDISISKKNDEIKIEATGREKKKKVRSLQATKDMADIAVKGKSKKEKEIQKQLKKHKKKERKLETKQKRKEKEQEAKEKEKEKEQKEAKKKKKEGHRAKKIESLKSDFKKRKQQRIEAKKREKDSNADDKKLKKQMAKIDKLNAKNRLKELKQEEIEMEALRKADTATDTNCLADFCIGLLKFAGSITLGLLKIIFKLLTEPKKSVDYIKKRIQDPKGTVFQLRKWLTSWQRRQKFRVMKTVKGSHTLSVLSDTFQDTTLYEAFSPKGKTNKERAFIEARNRRRKKRIGKRQREALYGCRHMLLTTLRKTPCLWIYHICPNHYAHCLSLVTFWRHFTDMLLFGVAVLFWTPCVLFFEALRGMLCCFFCT